MDTQPESTASERPVEPPEYTPYLNLSDAAKAAGVSRKTLYAHIDKGLVSVTRKQGKRFIHVAELERHYGSVTLKTSQRNKSIQPQTKQDAGQSEQMAELTAAIQSLQRETESLRAEVREYQKAAQDAAERVAGLLEDKTAKEVSASRSWWRKLWD
ncbi:helix-turn-helix domain-containing protein [Pantoea sp. ACRSH]|uniref:helix-turn-helix domain-containing protein n=1 Tax=unclassified Pantoea TaxID=2630326 RepID=UPI001EF4CC2A|nr:MULTISPECIES: helix-turn-helix domain-containing protein [unclassified Pantoea]MCG7368733.1 helix-turn-helix domain-containing protein [Pantoea sp. ACRSH]MCG7399125.1 helix-turn-helix domain-containing protein [Pantoea sp. ACRSC]